MGQRAMAFSKPRAKPTLPRVGRLCRPKGAPRHDFVLLTRSRGRVAAICARMGCEGPWLTLRGKRAPPSDPRICGPWLGPRAILSKTVRQTREPQGLDEAIMSLPSRPCASCVAMLPLCRASNTMVRCGLEQSSKDGMSPLIADTRLLAMKLLYSALDR